MKSSVPTIIFSGQFDFNASPYLHANIHYNYIPDTTDKLLFEVENGDHFIANGPDGGSGHVGERAYVWLENYLLDDSLDCELLLEIPPTASQYLTNIECEENILGDINGDEILNVLDIVLMIDIILNDEYSLVADVNEDGFVNILDVIIMVNILVGGLP